MNLGRRAVALVAACTIGVAACAAVTPSPPSDPVVATRPPTDVASAVASPSASSTSVVEPTFPADDLRAQIDVVRVEPIVTHPLLEFVSDGESILLSSALAKDAGTDAAPDLWRLVPPRTEPELLWRNPERNHSIVRIAGDLGLVAFVEMPVTGERAWSLWLLPRASDTPILLDRHPGDEDVSSLVPSLAVSEETVVWTAFDRGPDGPVSQLRVASAPEWEPITIHELPADEAEVWLPSLRGATLAYVEVRYSADRSTDERRVYLTTTAPGAKRLRLDTSGRATMPVLVDDAVLWKEADRGFNMFNWGRMFRYDLRTGEIARLSTAPQRYVNYPSAGARFATWWGADSFRLTVYDLVADEPRVVAANSIESQESEFQPHIAGDLLVWRHVTTTSPEAQSELRYAFLPSPRESR